MKINKSLGCSLFVMLFLVVCWSGSVVGMNLKPEWHTSASCKLILSVNDKRNLNIPFKAKYIVKLSHDFVFVAERDGGDDNSASTKVIFPDDFYIPDTNQKAWVDFNGQESVWEIYVNGELRESGTISFKRFVVDY